MNKEEFAKLASAIKTFYPRDNVLPNRQSLELWYGMLKDIPYPAAEAAVSKWVATQKWPPTVAEIREYAGQIIYGEALDWSSAWDQVMNAITRYGWYESMKALDCLDDLTKATVKRIGFEHLCHSENTRYEKDNFKEIYENLAKRRAAEASMPEALKIVINNVRVQMLEDKNDIGDVSKGKEV